MNKIKLSINQKLILGFSLPAISMIILGILVYNLTDLMKDQGIKVGVHNAPLGDAAMEIKLSALLASHIIEKYISGDENVDINEAWEKLNETAWYCNAILNGGTNSEGKFYPAKNENIRKNITQVQHKVRIFTQTAKEKIILASEGDNAKLKAVDKKFDSELIDFIKEADEAEEIIHGQMQEGIVELSKISDKVNMIIVSICLIIFILTIFLGFFVSKSINSLINKTIVFAQEVAGGNYGTKLEIERKDEIGRLANALRAMLDSFKAGILYAEKIANGNLISDKNIDFKNVSTLEKSLRSMEDLLSFAIRDISGATTEIIEGSNYINIAGSDIASGSNEQAASIEEISASMEQMVANINQNSENALICEKISVKAAEGIIKGNESFQATLTAMREIAEKISIIGEIAKKTDILAINAAIEAARAGEQGKGFAVVATEVRKLAENSQNAASEIQKLVDKSVRIAEESGVLLSEISPEIQRTAILVQEISSAGNEQNSGANQINNAVQELTKVIQQNSSAADQLAVSSKNMNIQAEKLQDSVSFFTIENAHNTTRNSKSLNTIANNHTSESDDEFDDLDDTFMKF